MWLYSTNTIRKNKMYNLHTGTKAARLIAPKRSDTVTKPSNWSLHMPCYSMSWKIFNFRILRYLDICNIWNIQNIGHCTYLATQWAVKYSTLKYLKIVEMSQIFKKFKILVTAHQSVTSRLETSRYRDFSQFLRVSVSVSNILVSKKSLGIGLENL